MDDLLLSRTAVLRIPKSLRGGEASAKDMTKIGTASRNWDCFVGIRVRESDVRRQKGRDKGRVYRFKSGGLLGWGSSSGRK